jgi:hypothetical protein
MKIIFFQSLFYLNCMALSWLCDYSEIDGPTTTHVLYKEETDIVKWLEKYEYCRAKGDPSVYEDAGQAKCEYSRNLCVYSNSECIFNQERENDPLEECIDLLLNNILSEELDWGRIPTETETESVETESVETESVETESVETESVETESAEIECTSTESVETESVETESIETESVETESVETECTCMESESESESESETESETESEERNIGIFSSSVKLTTEFLLLAFSFFIM